MAAYRNISVSFWTDSKVDDEFTPEDKYFFLYLLTNPHTNICGCYEISMRQMERETGYNADTIQRLINRMQNIHRVIMYSDLTKEILIVNWSRYNWSESDKLKKAVINVAKYIKNPSFRKIVCEILSGAEPVSVPVSVTVSDTESVTDVSIGYEYPIDTIPQKHKSSRFIPPTVDEVRAYCKERNNGIDPQAFYDFYEAKGWMVGKTKMKNWEAAVRTWEQRDAESGSRSQHNTLSNQNQKPIRTAAPPKSKCGTSLENNSIDMADLEALMMP
jgi:hypothetical protein